MDIRKLAPAHVVGVYHARKRWARRLAADHVVPRARRGAQVCRLATIVGAARAAPLYGGTDKHEHGYTTYYDRHLRGRRLKRLVVVEIGVGGYDSTTPGGSLRLWRDFFPRSRVVGVDLYAKQVDLGDRVRFVRADQSEPDDLRRVVDAAGGPLDVVIDDGSHVGDHVRTTFDTLFAHVASGGMYVIEDLHTSYWPTYGGNTDPGDATAVGLVTELIDAVQIHDRTFERTPELGPGPMPTYASVASVTLYPGIVFIEKR